MDLTTLLIMIIGIFSGFFVQTLMGFAGALIALPILVLAIQLPDAVAYISIFYMFSSMFLVKQEWRYINRKIILELLISSIIGVIAGVWLLGNSQPMILKKGLGFFILLYVIYFLFKESIAFKKNKLKFVLGFFGGFFSGVFSTGGPLYVILVKNSVTEIRTFRATMIGILAMVTFIRIPVLGWEGILTIHHFYYAMMVFPFFLLAQYLGKKAYNQLNETVLKRGILVLLLCSGILLVVKT